MKRKNPVKTVFLMLICITISFGLVIILNNQYLEQAARPVKVVQPEGYLESQKAQIQLGDIVQITGTPNLLYQVSQEPTDKSQDPNAVVYHYVGLKEYGFDFVVKIKKGKLESTKQTFIGKVNGISKTEFGSRIKNALNKPINFDEAVNEEVAKELDETSQSQIAQRSEGKFTDNSLLVLDEEVINVNEVYANIVIHSTLLSVFLVAFFRKKIF